MSLKGNPFTVDNIVSVICFNNERFSLLTLVMGKAESLLYAHQ